MVRLRPDVEWQLVDDEVVALDLTSSSYFSVNDTGAVLWPLVAAGTTEAAMVAELIARFDVDAAQARVDVEAFVQQLLFLALVEDS